MHVIFRYPTGRHQFSKILLDLDSFAMLESLGEINLNVQWKMRLGKQKKLQASNPNLLRITRGFFCLAHNHHPLGTQVKKSQNIM
jgi:hypothetical protein